jgi:hypothetical protein
MRAVVAVAFAVLASSSASLQVRGAEPPPIPVPPAPQPEVPEAKPIEPPAEPLTPETPPSGPEKTPKRKELPRMPAPEKKPSEGGMFGGACLGSALGCGTLGCLPGLGTAVGGSVLLTSLGFGATQGGVLGVCVILGGVVGGGVVGAPSAVLLGPCASGGALIGGVAGASLDDRSLAPVFIGAVPGLIAGLASTAGAIWGLVVLSNSSADYGTPALILASSAILALLSGPITIAGETIADSIAAAPASTTETVERELSDSIRPARMAF